MFDSVRVRERVGQRAMGGTLSLAFHGAVLAGVVFLSTRHAAPTPIAPLPPVLLFHAPAVAHPAPVPAPAPAPAATHHVKKRLAIPREKPHAPPPEAQTPVAEEPSEPAGPTIGTGVATGPTSGVAEGPPSPGPAPIAEEPTYVLGDGMTAPRLDPDASAPFRWTRAQLDARVEGLCLAQCTLTAGGTLRDCRILKRLAGVDDAQIFEYLAGLRFRPALLGDKPISIRSYTVPLRLRVP